ncbi:MAG TPA: M15 family metallopeptidase, partial [Bacilli bacterium]|nr:M15 family metallopeptidase [Bacilli bacterium]
MTKRKKSKKKRNRTIKLLIVLFLVILGAAYYIYYGMNNKEKIINNDDKLKEIGYSEIEITSINKNSEYLKYALNNEYNDKLTSLIKNKDFKIEYIDAYMKYINDNKDVSIDNAIYLVNNDINYKYSDYLVELSKEKYFLKTRIERYINYKYSHNDLSNTEIIKRVNSDIDNSFYTNIVNSDTSYNNLLICNKYYKLSNTYTGNLVNIESGYTTRGGKLDSTAYEAFKKLSDDARNQGLHILSQSAYRSYNDQDYIYNNYLKTNGKEWTDKWSARPGHSEHQTGLALDVATYT